MPDFEKYLPFQLRSAEQRKTDRYLATEKLATAVNTALAAEQPLLVTGEPGTGKSTLAKSIATQRGLALLTFHTRSDHQGRDLLYAFDNVRRFYDAQAGGPGLKKSSEYVEMRELGSAIVRGQSGEQTVVLIDEVDKASRDFPNDLLDVLDRMHFKVDETGQTFESKVRPIVVVTSNSERQLPDAFLRRCVFHHIEFPDAATLREILAVHLGEALPDKLADDAIARFQEIRRLPELEKRPATGELITWVKVLLKAGVPEDFLGLKIGGLPHLGALLKTQPDLQAARA